MRMSEMTVNIASVSSLFAIANVARKQNNHLQNSGDPCSLCISRRFHNDYEAGSLHPTSHRNTMSNDTQTRTLGTPLHPHSSSSEECVFHSMESTLFSPAVMSVNHKPKNKNQQG